ncbi:MAG: hypothetical protein AAF985_23065, partial [Bacteroidota bacterium]
MNATNDQVYLQQYCSDRQVTEELGRYLNNKFTNPTSEAIIPLQDESFIDAWKEYLQASRGKGVFSLLQEKLVQLQFPIQEGISQTLNYRAACLRGQTTANMAEATGLALQKADEIQLILHQSAAGKIPVLLVPHPEDFKSIVRALAHRNEPVAIPDSMGASMIKGLNNWDRIRQLQEEWSRQHPQGNWSDHFKACILPHPKYYQDKLMILSEKPYSDVPAAHLGLSPEEWLILSETIRLDHECTHYFTLRYFGIMANNMHDELMADYMGICAAMGQFDLQMFLHCLGLERFPNYRSGARLEN